MNFLKLILKLYTLFFLSLAFTVYSQSSNSGASNAPTPLVVKLSHLPSDFMSNYGTIISANESLILILRDNTLQIFDGINWEKVIFPSKPLFTTSPSGDMYFAYNNKVEAFRFKPDGLIHREVILNPKTFDFEAEITSIAVDSAGTLFFTDHNKLWQYSSTTELVDSSLTSLKLIKSYGDIYYSKDNLGVFRVNGSEGLNPTVKFSNSVIQIIQVGNNPVAITSTYPWLVSLKDSPFHVNLPAFMTQSKTVHLKRATLQGEDLYLLFTDNTVVKATINETSTTVSLLKIHNIFDHIVDLYPYSKETLLLLSPSALHSISNVTVKGLYVGDPNSTMLPQALCYANNILYCGTEQGLFKASYQGVVDGLEFQQVGSIIGSVKRLHSHPTGVYVEARNGLFVLNGSNARLLGRVYSHTQSVQSSFVEMKGDLWFVTSGDQAIQAYCLSTMQLKHISISLPDSVKQVEQIKGFDEFLMVQVEGGEWYSIDFASNNSSWHRINMAQHQFGMFVFPMEQNAKPFVKTENSLFRYDYRHDALGDKLVCDSVSQYYPVLETDSSMVMLRFFEPFTDIYTLWLYTKNASGQIGELKQPVAPHLSAESLVQAVLLPDNILFVATNTGLRYYKQSSSHVGSRPTAAITHLTLGMNNRFTYVRKGYLVDEGIIISRNEPGLRDLKARFSSNTSGGWESSFGNVQYSSFLTTYDSDWTPWTSNSLREIPSLTPGAYTLKLKTRNYWGQESEIVVVEFVVRPYFYETPYFIVAFFLLAFLSVFTTFRWRSYSHAKVRFKLESLINIRTDELVREKEKTDNLLARVLPKETASELKEKGRVNTQRFQVVTVLFCDIEGFTRITDETNPEVLIDQLDRFFLYFDSVVEKYRIEKIKTIGDAYMCAGGIPQKNRTNPVEVILAALEMTQYMRDLVRQAEDGESIWELRIGIDTGPVIAGVVGRNKLSYDIWGSTVNTASRMESSGEVGQINISGNTYMLVNEYFDCTFRGSMPVKNKGDIEMYFVNGIKPELSVDLQGVVPNFDFQIQLQLVRLYDLEDFVLEKLENGLPQNLYYHNLKHTIDVYTQVELIGRSEMVSMEELLLLRTAALLHDAGHLIDYDTHEEMAVKLAREILPEYYYTERQISIISELIMSTQLPPRPKNLLEEIMCDADLDYLGRTDFIPVSNMLYRELHEHGKIGSLRDWNEMQVKFITKHSYFTKTACKLRNVNKQSQLDKLKTWMAEN